MEARQNTVQGKTHTGTSAFYSLGARSNEKSFDPIPFDIPGNRISKDFLIGLSVLVVHTIIVSQNDTRRKEENAWFPAEHYRGRVFFLAFLFVAGGLSFFFTVELGAKMTTF